MSTATAQALEEELPDDPDIIEKATATLRFIGQAWINDRARNTDDGTVEFEVPLSDLRTDDDEWALHGPPVGHHISDRLKNHDNAPEWVTNWRGPFTIKLRNWEA